MNYSNKVMLVTGGSGEIEKLLLQHIARKMPKLYYRNPSKNQHSNYNATVMTHKNIEDITEDDWK